MKPYYEESGVVIYNADCRDALPVVSDSSVDSIVCDPPYELGFMGKGWDRSGIAYDLNVWRECLRVLKPGGHLLAFGGSRTYHRLACAVEDAGFEIRDQIQWIYGSGFPKSLDVSKAIDAAAGAEREVAGMRTIAYADSDCWSVPNRRTDGTCHNPSSYSKDGNIVAGMRPFSLPVTDAAKQWQGWGTALKPAHEPIVLARKPLIGTVAENVLKHGTGGLNIDGCRVATGEVKEPTTVGGLRLGYHGGGNGFERHNGNGTSEPLGRWPANVIHDGSEEVLAGFPESSTTGARRDATKPYNPQGAEWFGWRSDHNGSEYQDSGSAARFFYCAKASKEDRGEGNNHPTVKPTKLMRYLVRLVTPPGGTVLDPFGGSGSTAKACRREGFNCILIEKEVEYCALAVSRLPKVQTLNFEAVA